MGEGPRVADEDAAGMCKRCPLQTSKSIVPRRFKPDISARRGGCVRSTGQVRNKWRLSGEHRVKGLKLFECGQVTKVSRPAAKIYLACVRREVTLMHRGPVPGNVKT